MCVSLSLDDHCLVVFSAHEAGRLTDVKTDRLTHHARVNKVNKSKKNKENKSVKTIATREYKQQHTRHAAVYSHASCHLCLFGLMNSKAFTRELLTLLSSWHRGVSPARARIVDLCARFQSGLDFDSRDWFVWVSEVAGFAFSATLTLAAPLMSHPGCTRFEAQHGEQCSCLLNKSHQHVDCAHGSCGCAIFYFPVGYTPYASIASAPIES